MAFHLRPARVLAHLDDSRATMHDYESRATSARDTIIIQGIIDMLVKTPDGLLVIDFKTDAITAKQVPQRAEFYQRATEPLRRSRLRNPELTNLKQMALFPDAALCS